MITEDYVSFETAKLLNEKGFKQECDYATSWYAKQYYKNSCQGEWFEGEHQIIEDIDDKCNISYLSSNNIFIPAPTQQKVMKWLREVHGIHISVVMGCDVDNPQHFFFAPNICKFSVKTVEYQTPFPEKEFDTYELACEETIKYCLENLI